MKLITKVGLTLGSFLIIISTIRWFFLYYDPSQMVMGVLIGSCILAGTWLHSKFLEVLEEQENINKRLDAFSKFYMKEEFK
jgi:hypothetical protein